jgi:hypothetical protein
MNARICKHCSYWDEKQLKELDSERTGKCVGKIPNSIVVMQQGFGGQPVPAVMTFWPETRDSDRCGEWKSIDAANGSGTIL